MDFIKHCEVSALHVVNLAEPTVLHLKYDDLCIQEDRECTMYSMIHSVASVVSKLMLQWFVP